MNFIYNLTVKQILALIALIIIWLLITPIFYWLAEGVDGSKKKHKKK